MIQSKIGIGITTHNRNKESEHTIEQIKKYAPKGAKIVVVDDASEITNKYADFVFKSNVGIAAAKNKCIELLSGSDYFFLFDDDCYPIVEDWHERYIQSRINHLCFTFSFYKNKMPSQRKLLSINDNICEYETPCGCMLFFTKECVNRIGGFDTDFKYYGYEHVDFSMRIFNAKLNHKPFLDLKDSHNIFFSKDWARTIVSSVNRSIRSQYGYKNRELFYKNINSSEFKKYD